MNEKFGILFFISFLVVLLPVLGFGQPDIPMNPELKSNCIRWKVMVKQNGIWGKKPAMVNFGQLKTISTGAGKYAQTSGQVDVELFWKNIRTVKSNESSMSMELGKGDTALVRMLTIKEEITKEKNTAGTLVHVNGDDEESYQNSSWIDEMIVQLPGDSGGWHYHALDSGATMGALKSIREPNLMVLIYKVNNLEGKKMKEVMFSQPAIGFVFAYQGKQVAAVQTLMKQMIWVSNTLDPVLRNAIMATAAAIVATLKSGNANGY